MIADGGWMVSEYINRDEVVAMVDGGEQEAQQAAASRTQIVNHEQAHPIAQCEAKWDHEHPLNGDC